MSETSLRFNFLKGKDTASPEMKKIAGNATAMSTAMRVASIASVAGMVTLGAAIAGVAAHAIALGQSAIIASQSVLLLPAALAGAVGTAIAGKVAFSGLGEAWKATGAAAAKGGASAADAAHQVEMANRSVRDATQALADAQREATAAQDAVTRARETASERLEDLSRALRGARLDERGAVLALQEARTRLAQTKRDGGGAEAKRAQIAYEEAALSLESVRDRVQDVTKEQQEAASKGVEGSEDVLDATRRQEQAQRQLVSATERLADAQRELAQAGKSAGGGTDQAAQALAKLAPSAAAVVVALRAMGPAWSAAGKGAQQAAFAGVAGDMQKMSALYLPSITSWLGQMGSAFNIAMRDVFKLAQTREFAAALAITLGAMSSTFKALSAAAAPFLSGIMQFVAAGSTLLPGIAGTVGSIAERFERWAMAARESGKMQEWITTGIGILGQFWDVAKNLVGTLLAIFKAGDNAGTLDALVKGSAALKTWAESAEGQQKIADTLAFLRDIFNQLIQVVPAFIGNAGTLSDTLSVFGVVVSFLADHLDTVAAALPAIITGFLVWKTLQAGANAAMIIGIPLRMAEMVTNLTSAAAMRAHTAALRANTAAALTGDTVQKKSLVTSAAMRIATMAQAAANWILAPSTWAVLGPILLIIAAIAILIVVIVLIIKYHKEIGQFFVFIWGKIWDFLKMIGAWFAGPFVQFFKDAWAYIVGLFDAGVTWVMGWVNRFLAPILAIKDHIAKVGIWQTLVDGFKAAINGLISLWNKLDFSIGPFSIPNWVPFGLGGNTFHIPDIFPDIPKLDVGGQVTSSGLAVIHQGETVVPAAETAAYQRGGNSGGRQVVELRSDGSQLSDWIMELLRKAVRDRGGDVQFVLGK